MKAQQRVIVGLAISFGMVVVIPSAYAGCNTVGGIETIDGAASTGKCYGATGRLRYMGIFEGGCVDCKYDGEVCVVGKKEEEDDD